MESKLNKIIVHSLTKNQLEIIEAFLQANGCSKYPRKVNLNNGDIAVRIFSSDDISRYMLNSSTSYLKYHSVGMKPYKEDKLVTWEEFRNEFLLTEDDRKNIKELVSKGTAINRPKQTEPQEIKEGGIPKHLIMDFGATIQPILNIERDKVIEAYKKTTNLDIKQLLKTLFGKSLFEEVFYRIGNKFSYNEKIFTIAKINTGVVTVLDQDMDNFCMSKPVQDPYKITESELKNLLGIYFDKFTLIK